MIVVIGVILIAMIVVILIAMIVVIGVILIAMIVVILIAMIVVIGVIGVIVVIFIACHHECCDEAGHRYNSCVGLIYRVQGGQQPLFEE
jgi:hypothetical protein